MSVPTKEMPDEPPPMLGRWSRVYIAVVIYLATLITVFYFFARSFS